MVKRSQKIHWLLPTSCFSVFDHFVGLRLKELKCLPGTGQSLKKSFIAIFFVPICFHFAFFWNNSTILTVAWSPTISYEKVLLQGTRTPIPGPLVKLSLFFRYRRILVQLQKCVRLLNAITFFGINWKNVVR